MFHALPFTTYQATALVLAAVGLGALLMPKPAPGELAGGSPFPRSPPSYELSLFPTGNLSGFIGKIPVSLEVELSKIPGVYEVVPTLTEVDSLENKKQIVVVGFRPGTRVLGLYTITEGRQLQRSDRFAAVINQNLAKQTATAVGDEFLSLGVRWQIVGIFKPVKPSDPDSYIGLIIPLEELQLLSPYSAPNDPRVDGFLIATIDSRNQALHRKVQVRIQEFIDKVKQERTELRKLKALLIKN